VRGKRLTTSTREVATETPDGFAFVRVTGVHAGASHPLSVSPRSTKTAFIRGVRCHICHATLLANYSVWKGFAKKLPGVCRPGALPLEQCIPLPVRFTDSNMKPYCRLFQVWAYIQGFSLSWFCSVVSQLRSPATPQPAGFFVSVPVPVTALGSFRSLDFLFPFRRFYFVPPVEFSPLFSFS
jgi:hypothetical protein